jgi:hypothetical protein
MLTAGRPSGSPCGAILLPWAAEPYRLYSQLEIMQPFYAQSFLSTIRALETIIILRQSERLVPIPDDLRAVAQAHFVDLAPLCGVYGLTASRITAERINRLLSARDDSPVETLRLLIVELQGRLIDELSAPRFFSVTDKEADHYNNPRKEWESVLGRFGSAVVDIEEARKCYALARYTAAVFHCLQVVEVGLIALGGFIGVTDPLSGWTAVTKRLKTIVDKKYSERTDFEKEHFAFLEQVQATAEALKNAWRNKVSHVQGRLAVALGGEFTPEIAEEIMMATRSFMRRLAEEMPTDGAP